MSDNWIVNELNSSDLGDERLNQRLIILADSFTNSPESPINQACSNWTETKAAYRFFKNDKVSYQKISQAHINTTTTRCLEHAVILAVQDTSYFNYSSHKKTKGLSLLTKKTIDNNKEFSAVGLIMHSCLAITTKGLPLGLLDQKIYSRKPFPKEKIKIKRKSYCNALPIEEKESNRWLESLKNSNNVFSNENIQLVNICDREADIYDFFLLSENIQAKVLVRANHNRFLNNECLGSYDSCEKLWQFMQSQISQGTIKINIPKQDKQESRIAICNVYYSKVSLNPTYRKSKSKTEKLSDLNLYAIYVKENKQENSDCIDWMLLTNIPINTFEKALEKIRWYCLRWKIEVFHKILKSGLKVEDCRLSEANRLIRYLSIMSIVAWRIFWITTISRACPESSCLVLFNDEEWKVLFYKFNNNKSAPKTPPNIRTCVIWIAQLGGFLARKNDKEPGITYIWRGLKKFSNILEGFELGKKFVGNS